MFKEIQSGLAKFFTKEFVLVVIIFLVLVWGLLSYSGDKISFIDQMQDGTNMPGLQVPEDAPLTDAPSAPVSAGKAEPGYALQPVANPSDLLPKDKNSQWSALNPSVMKDDDVMMPDLLQAGHHIGLDTIGQSLRNANLQLRSDPVISKADVGPWNQSTIESDLGRVPLELGR